MWNCNEFLKPIISIIISLHYFSIRLLWEHFHVKILNTGNCAEYARHKQDILQFFTWNSSAMNFTVSVYIGHKFVYYQKLFRVTNSSVIISHGFQVKLMSQWMIFFIEICESQYCSSLWHFIHTCGMVPLTRLGMSSLVYPRLVRPSGTSRSCMISRRRSPRIGPASSTFLFVMSTPVKFIQPN